MPDMDIKRVVDSLMKKKKVVELVALMKPLDVAKIVAGDLGLCPKDASRATVDLIKHAHTSRYEGLSAPSIEKLPYPVPDSQDKSGEPMLSDPTYDEHIARPFGKTVNVQAPDVVRWHFPPDPRDEPEGWPYDDATTAGMDPKARSPKRPLMTAKDNNGEKITVYTFRSFNPDMRQPGGDGAGGGGVYRKAGVNVRHNNMSSRGQSWDRKGMPGWSSSPRGQEFDLPGDEKEENMGGMAKSVNSKPVNAGDEDDRPAFMKNAPVGSSIPTLGKSAPQRRQGFRRR